MRFIIFIFILTSLIASCKLVSQQVNVGFQKDGYMIPYALNTPTYSFYPDKELKEISGMDIDLATNKIYAVQDEKGFLYEIDTTGAIISKIDIGDDGDYEGLEIHGGLAFIVESDGVITVVDISKKEKIEKLKNNLDDKNDIEGLAATADGSLLLICKKDNLDNKKDAVKDIYIKSPTGDNDVQPYSSISTKDIQALDPINLQSNDFIKMMINGRLANFAPSGMDRHPNGDLYIISSRSGTVTILEDDQIMKGTFFTRKSINVQPEGICFDKQGQMYIANEAKGSRAVVRVYSENSEIK